jgi:hypothetical protein
MDGDLIMMVGFVLATDMVVVVGVGPAGAGLARPIAAPEVVDVGADAPETYPRGTCGARPPMWWNNNTSGFVRRRMCQIVSDGSRSDKCFKDKDVNCVAKALKEYSGEVVSSTQVYNHLRKWR